MFLIDELFLFSFISDLVLVLCVHCKTLYDYESSDIQTFPLIYLNDVIFFFLSKLYMHIVGPQLILWEEKV